MLRRRRGTCSGMARRDPQTDRPVVEVENLHKSYGQIEVLKGVSLSARTHDVVTLIGSSGSGKSTLLRCINLLELPSAGRILIDGEELIVRSDPRGPRVDERQANLIRMRVGMVFQSFNLWPHMTVLENVMEAPIQVHKENKAEVRDRSEALLAKVGLADKRDCYPAFLSGGQQQRVAIARALAIRPRLLLFDEPTSALDPELVGEVLRVIQGLAEEGATMVLVTHEMAFARRVSTQVAFLHKGCIDEVGSPDQVFGDPTSDRCRQFVSGHEGAQG